MIITTGGTSNTYDATDSGEGIVIQSGIDELVLTVNDFNVIDFAVIEFRCSINAEAARAVLRLGLFVVMNPSKRYLPFRQRYWRRLMRCNRYGIGLRIGL